MQCGMTEEHRAVLRNNCVELVENLQTDQILPHLKELLNEKDEDEIKCAETERKKSEKLLDILPRKGGEAFASFVAAVRKVQNWLANDLARLGNIDNSGNTSQVAVPRMSSDEIAPSSAMGMRPEHRDILRKYSFEFSKKLDVKQMVDSLVECGILSDALQKHILGQPSHQAKVDELMKILPKSGPDAFKKFYLSLKLNQPQLAVDFKFTGPGLFNFNSQETDTPSPESSNVTAKTGENAASSPASNISLLTPFYQLPEDVKQLIYNALDTPDDFFNNDWKKLYKILKMPAGKEEVIVKKGGSPTQHLITQWIKKEGKKATLQRLLCALSQCDHGELIMNIEAVLRVEFDVTSVPAADQVDNVQTMMAGAQITRAEEKPAKVGPLKIIKEIPDVLKTKLAEQFDVLQVNATVLGELATNITEKKCNVESAVDFLEKINEEKIRCLFRELKKHKNGALLNIAKWMRKTFPVGSTGPLKDDDEIRPSKMKYTHRREITRILDLDDQWKLVAGMAGMGPNDIKHVEQRGKEPAETVFSFWEVRSKSTVGTLYDLLVSAGCLAVADLL